MNLTQTVKNRHFNEQKLDVAINSLIYGQELDIITNKKKSIRRRYIYIHEILLDHLYVVKMKMQKVKSIKLQDISYIYGEPFDSRQSKELLYLTLRNRQVCFRLKSKIFRDILWQGLEYFIANHQSKFIERQFVSLNIDGGDQLNTVAIDNLTLKLKEYTSDETELAYLQETSEMTFLQFSDFISRVVDSKELQNIYDTQHQKVSYEQFRDSLLSMDNQILDINQEHDMDQPLQMYYINSSHNTYLEQNQLTGKSSVWAYISALRRGCKCLELDCWDGPDRPMIYHGYTMTSRILFEDVIQAINQYGFELNPYPIVLSLELHCGLIQQQIMAEIMMRVFGEKLYIMDEKFNTLPSPNQLMNRILIKSSGSLLEARNISRGFIEYSTQTVSPGVSFREQQAYDEPEPAIVPATTKNQRQRNMALKPDIIYDKTAEKPFNRQVLTQDIAHNGTQQIIIAGDANFKYNPKFLATVSLFNETFSLQASNRSVWNTSSLSEDKVAQLWKDSYSQIREFTNKFLIRTYPKGTRVDSSNYDPMPAFLIGAQLIALNFQTNDVPMLLNISKFQDNQNCGYLLKSEEFQASTQFTIDIIMISKLPQPKCNLYVQLEVRGHPADQQVYKTKIVVNNSINPVFNESFEIRLTDPDNAIILFFIQSTKLIAQYGISYQSMRSGYRAVPLRDLNLELINDCFILINLKQ